MQRSRKWYLTLLHVCHVRETVLVWGSAVSTNNVGRIEPIRSSAGINGLLIQVEVPRRPSSDPNRSSPMMLLLTLKAGQAFLLWLAVHPWASLTDGGGDGITVTVLVCWSLPSGDPSAAMVDTRCSHMIRRRAARVLLVFSLDDPWPPKAMVETD